MRAAVIMAFHHPVTGKMLERGHELFDKHDDRHHSSLDVILKDPELAHRVAVTDRTPMADEPTPAPAAVSAPPLPVPAPSPARSVAEAQ